MVHKLTIHLFLITLIIHHIHSQPLQSKSQLLTPSNHNINGINITTSTTEVTPTLSNEWNITINSQTTYQFIISIDSTWGFHPNIKSSIKLTINSPSIATGPSTFDDIIFGFTTDNTKYISTWIPMDNNGQKNRIYPNCDRSSTPKQSLGIGNIELLPNTDRNCDVAGGSCNNWNTIHPKNAQHPNIYQYNHFPITFTLENDPNMNILFIYFDSIRFTDDFIQKCGFISMPTNEGLKIYIGGNDNEQQFVVSSFLIESFFNISDPFISSNTSNNITIIDTHDDINKINTKIDENNNTESNGNNINIVIGVIVGLFVMTIIGALLHIKYGLRYKDMNNVNNDNDFEKDDEKHNKNNSKNNIELVKDIKIIKCEKNIRKFSHLEGDDSEFNTESNIRWHNLNVLLPGDNNGSGDGDSHDTNEIPPPVYQYD